MNDIQVNLLFYVAGYSLFFAFLIFAGKKEANRLTNSNGTLVYSRLLLLFHAAGIFLFGILPFFATYPAPAAFFIPGNWLGTPSVVSLLLFVLMLFISPRLARQHRQKNPVGQSRSQTLPLGYLLLYFFLRTLFIIAYEVWFRGFLLSDCMTAWGLPLALAVNIILYTLLHIVNGKKEMLGCIPFGLLLCLLTRWQGTIWPAVLIHLALSVPYEWILAKHQKNKTLPHENLYHRRVGLHRA